MTEEQTKGSKAYAKRRIRAYFHINGTSAEPPTEPFEIHHTKLNGYLDTDHRSGDHLCRYVLKLSQDEAREQFKTMPVPIHRKHAHERESILADMELQALKNVIDDIEQLIRGNIEKGGEE
jgi:hypothetical protein